MAGSFNGRKETENNTGGKCNIEGDEADFEINEGLEWGKGGAKNGGEVAKNKASKATSKNKENALEEELEKNVWVGGANGLTDTDLVSAFGNRN